MRPCRSPKEGAETPPSSRRATPERARRIARIGALLFFLVSLTEERRRSSQDRIVVSGAYSEWFGFSFSGDGKGEDWLAWTYSAGRRVLRRGTNTTESALRNAILLASVDCSAKA